MIIKDGLSTKMNPLPRSLTLRNDGYVDKNIDMVLLFILERDEYEDLLLP
jgi:hypothetical protein